ncbi:MAG: CubicO group peptidase (beta-lactamase class C family) [Candidatus Arcticimaribacter sp.]
MLGFFCYLLLEFNIQTMIKKITLLPLALFFLNGIIAQSTSTFSQEKLLEFNSYIQKEIDAKHIAGAEILIVQNDIVEWHESIGESNTETHESLAKNSIYYIQSMTKPIISVAIMQLVEKGLLGLDDAVYKYIPEVKSLKITTDTSLGLNGPTKPKKNTMTLRHLLSHTAGLTHGLGSNKFDQELFKLLYNETLNYKGHPNLESRINVLMNTPLIGEPGEQWVYSTGPDLLALILQRVSKQSVPEYLKEHIFAPLGMNDTGYNLNEQQAKRVMQLHNQNEAGGMELSPLQVPTQGNTVYGGTHGLFSSTKDYLTFCQMILHKGTWNGSKVLSEETIALMSENHVKEFLGPSRGFGLGFGIIRNSEIDPSPGSTGQLNWGGYFRTHFFIDQSLNLIALFMTQKMPANEDYSGALNQYVYAALK